MSRDEKTEKTEENALAVALKAPFKAWHRLMTRAYAWAGRLSVHPRALWIFAALAFAESSFFPIPVDVFMIPLILLRPRDWLKICAAATVFSVVGGVAGYGIGLFFYDALAVPLLEFYGYMDKFHSFRGLYNKYDIWIILIGGFSPFPYKVITIASGVMQMDFVVFTLGSVLSRGARFFLVGYLIHKFGPPAKPFIERNLGPLSILFILLLAGSFMLVKLF